MRDKIESPAPETSEQSLPFFARFLEGQQTTNDAFMTLKYPSDRDEIEPYASSVHTQAAPTEAAPSRMTLKYPSDRDEIEPYVAPYGNAPGAQ